MGKQNHHRNHIDPEYQRWGRKYPTFPGVDECVRLILGRKATGAWADIIRIELAENASAHLDEMIAAFHNHTSDSVALYMLMALETAALPASVAFLAEVLHSDNATFVSYATAALTAIDTKESRTALFNA